MKTFKFLFIALAFFVATAASAQDIPKWKISQLEQLISQTDKPTIINFWATFCVPCIEELPYFQKAANQHQSDSVQVILVSLDLEDAYPKKIKTFASKLKISAPIVFLDETNADVFCPAVDKDWSGAIPATLFINNKTGYRKFIEDQLTAEQLDKEIKALVDVSKKVKP